MYKLSSNRLFQSIIKDGGIFFFLMGGVCMHAGWVHENKKQTTSRWAQKTSQVGSIFTGSSNSALVSYKIILFTCQLLASSTSAYALNRTDDIAYFALQ